MPYARLGPTRNGRPCNPPRPEEKLFEPRLDAPPLAWPALAPRDFYAGRRNRAEHLCLFMACRRMKCRDARRCLGERADCVLENPEVKTPILEEIVPATNGPR
jgi:hypothetical protein